MTSRRFIRCAGPTVNRPDDMLATMRTAGQGRGGLLVTRFNESDSADKLLATMLPWQAKHCDLAGGI